jgi:hypothetical protein
LSPVSGVDSQLDRNEVDDEVPSEFDSMLE